MSPRGAALLLALALPAPGPAASEETGQAAPALAPALTDQAACATAFSAKVLLQAALPGLAVSPLGVNLEKALKRGAKLKLLLAEPGPESDRFRKLGALVRFSSRAAEQSLIVADARLAWRPRQGLEPDAAKAADLSLKFEALWKKASPSAAAQWEKEFKALPDPRGPEDYAPRVKTRRRK